MKLFTLAIAALLTYGIANASQTLTCVTHVPEGKALVKVVQNTDGYLNIFVKFHNNSLNQDFNGTFKTNQFGSKRDSILARGVFKAPNGDVIQSGVQGSLIPDPTSGSTFLSIYAGRDHRIEFGYGLHLICK